MVIIINGALTVIAVINTAGPKQIIPYNRSTIFVDKQPVILVKHRKGMDEEEGWQNQGRGQPRGKGALN
jgi:hypothetical protein